MAAFKFLVKTDNLGTSSSVQFTLPLRLGYSYNFDVDWGDTNVDTITTDTSPTHTYASAGTYEVSITENIVGGLPTIYFNNGGDRLKITDLTAWGTNKWIILEDSFYGCSNLIISATDEATANTSSVTNFEDAWNSCTALTSFPLIDTSSGTGFSRTWNSCSALTSFPLINTSSGTNFNSAWKGCNSLTSFPLIDTSSGTIFRDAWNGCTSLTSFPLIDTSSGTDFRNTWYQCSSLTSFPLIDVSSATGITSLQGTWEGCTSLTSFPLIDMSSATRLRSTWEGCTSLTSFPLIDTSSATYFRYTWSGCTSLTSFPILDMSSGTDFVGTWTDCPLSTDSYSDIIEYLADNNTNTGITLDANLAKYYESVAPKHTILTDVRSWNITDAGSEPDPEPERSPYNTMDFIGMPPAVLFTSDGGKISDTKLGNPKGDVVIRDENLVDGSADGKPVRTSRGGAGSSLGMYSKPSWLSRSSN